MERIGEGSEMECMSDTRSWPAHMLAFREVMDPAGISGITGLCIEVGDGKYWVSRVAHKKLYVLKIMYPARK
jgi:hypothetical protein